ncbi:nuclear speckle RNA-binding protein B [Amaranthus tricolor]|uniref:nuclear speckle RNA-binding protein B n=1 Tax=Amaranthus tricolor TaxID=29722 RepID=UPI00258DA0D3|nr:nuclear speckle RNA-binding protein B [Amaranthus tricolor]
MDNNQDYTGNTRPTRKELLGPRPSPLKVRKDSHKIRKPPMAPSAAAQPQAPPQPPRQPVIIYTVSPKVIHTHPSEFLNLVQRLTGADHATSSSSSVSSQYHHNTAHHVSGAISPAARLASIEMTKMHSDGKRFVGPSEGMQREINIGGNTGGGGITGVERIAVLSPGPGSLPQISPNLFSPLFQDPSSNINLQHDLNVVQHGNRNFTEGNYLSSPFSTNFVSPGTMISPSSLEFLHRILDN